MLAWKEYKALIALVALIVSATAGAIIYFTPMAFAEYTRQMIERHELKEQLFYVENRIWEIERTCTNLATEEWKCSDQRLKEQYDLRIERSLLMKELEIGDE